MAGDLNWIGTQIEDATDPLNSLRQPFVTGCLKVNYKPAFTLIRSDGQNPGNALDLDHSPVRVIQDDFNTGNCPWLKKCNQVCPIEGISIRQANFQAV
jgi:hypothetical protein